MTDQKTSVELLLLHPDDNVVLIKRSLPMGHELLIEDECVTITKPMIMGHKLARCAVTKGTPILKYGARIGLAAKDIALGDHVHLHNIESEYTTIEDMEKS